MTENFPTKTKCTFLNILGLRSRRRTFKRGLKSPGLVFFFKNVKFWVAPQLFTCCQAFLARCNPKSADFLVFTLSFQFSLEFFLELWHIFANIFKKALIYSEKCRKIQKRSRLSSLRVFSWSISFEGFFLEVEFFWPWVFLQVSK